jgi:hypothetical protein
MSSGEIILILVGIAFLAAFVWRLQLHFFKELQAELEDIKGDVQDLAMRVGRLEARVARIEGGLFDKVLLREDGDF